MAAHTFEVAHTLPAPAAEAFDWHGRPGAFDRLKPPWKRVQVLEAAGDIHDGARVVLRVPLGPFGVRWYLEHQGWVEHRQFQDVQIRGPFAAWEHTHHFLPVDGQSCTLSDSIDYTLPLQAVTAPLMRRLLERQLTTLFCYRHRVTHDDLLAHARYANAARLRVAISGASGLIGQALTSYLTTAGHRVLRLVRGAPSTRDEIAWSADEGVTDVDALGRVDAIVHLAGEPLASGRWTPARMERMRSSRINGTRALAESLARHVDAPRVFVVASGVGYYGDRGSTRLTEASDRGTGYLAELADAWEQAADPARDAGVRVVHARLGMVLSGAGGALPQMLRGARMGVSTQVGDGQQYISWVALDDVLGIIETALFDEHLTGVVNAAAPEPVTSRTFARTLARVLRRQALGRLPAFVARRVFGKMADELLLASTRVEPAVLLRHGYAFRDADLETALRHQLGK